VLGVMSDGNWIRGVTVPSHIVMWDMAMEYVA
jgi:hypothetical protein